eukprot:CAMPEP_0194414036 /NCGR_PEP_ID=MMETSP0176-20130528/12596_1 /TAXON_ID=216777 /ORGANISM="Proboscia alata, Strain PI-D3" /LENGTH=1081 /DNA_ID=CAMNT_0039217711 /DNA_START=153 /DNA_END=3398 /DNA_ORIENTATION=+
MADATPFPVRQNQHHQQRQQQVLLQNGPMPSDEHPLEINATSDQHITISDENRPRYERKTFEELETRREPREHVVLNNEIDINNNVEDLTPNETVTAISSADLSIDNPRQQRQDQHEQQITQIISWEESVTNIDQYNHNGADQHSQFRDAIPENLIRGNEQHLPLSDISTIPLNRSSVDENNGTSSNYDSYAETSTNTSINDTTRLWPSGEEDVIFLDGDYHYGSGNYPRAGFVGVSKIYVFISVFVACVSVFTSFSPISMSISLSNGRIIFIASSVPIEINSAPPSISPSFPLWNITTGCSSSNRKSELSNTSSSDSLVAAIDNVFLSFLSQTQNEMQRESAHANTIDGDHSKILDKHERSGNINSINSKRYDWLPNILRPEEEQMCSENSIEAFLGIDNEKETDGMFNKILNSTPRLFAVVNVIIIVVYLLYASIIRCCLGMAEGYSSDVVEIVTVTDLAALMIASIMNINNSFSNESNGATATLGLSKIDENKRLIGFVLIQILLISSVVKPSNHLHFFIILVWYTLLGILFSLSRLASLTTSKASESSPRPRRGVLYLLGMVVVFDVCTMLGLGVLFYNNWGVGGRGKISLALLIIYDCVWLLLDVVTNIFQHTMQFMKIDHEALLDSLEQENMKRIMKDLRGNKEGKVVCRRVKNIRNAVAQSQEQENQRNMDRKIEIKEKQHYLRSMVIEKLMFVLKLMSSTFTLCHVVHIWFMRGFTFGLLDIVLALHIYTSVTIAVEKICDHCVKRKKSRDFEAMFKNAPLSDLCRAFTSREVCCVCLRTLCTTDAPFKCAGSPNVKSKSRSFFKANNGCNDVNHGYSIKRIGCGHLFHSRCLREVIECSKSSDDARCPLCRALVSDCTNHHTTSLESLSRSNNNTNIANASVNQESINDSNEEGTNVRSSLARETLNDVMLEDEEQRRQGENALFRFSTEGILSSWLRLPALSFEIQRPSAPVRALIGFSQPTETNERTIMGNHDTGSDTHFSIDRATANVSNRTAHSSNTASFARRFFQRIGIISLSPEEEAVALEQLVEMFPQFDRSNLLRCLRERGSADRVVSSYLVESFRGVPGGGLG